MMGIEPDQTPEYHGITVQERAILLHGQAYNSTTPKGQTLLEYLTKR